MTFIQIRLKLKSFAGVEKIEVFEEVKALEKNSLCSEYQSQKAGINVNLSMLSREQLNNIKFNWHLRTWLNQKAFPNDNKRFSCVLMCNFTSSNKSSINVFKISQFCCWIAKKNFSFSWKLLSYFLGFGLSTDFEKFKLFLSLMDTGWLSSYLHVLMTIVESLKHWLTEKLGFLLQFQKIEIKST